MDQQQYTRYGSSTGLVTGVSAGTAVITYTVGTVLAPLITRL